MLPVCASELSALFSFRHRRGPARGGARALGLRPPNNQVKRAPGSRYQSTFQLGFGTIRTFY